MPSRHPHVIRMVYIPFKEDEVNEILSLISLKIKAIQKNPKARGFNKQVQLFSTMRNNLRKSKQGLTNIREAGSPITKMEDWERVVEALKYQQAGEPEKDCQGVLEAVQTWVTNHNYDPSAPEEQAKRIQIRNNQHRKAISLAIFNVDEILPLIQMVDKKNSHKIELAGHMVNVCSKRLQTFKTHGVKCITCGLVGEYFSLEYHKGDNHGKEHPHLNLYAVEEGRTILMTHDHINPLSNGGPDHLDNMQTMCSPCNSVKGPRQMK